MPGLKPGTSEWKPVAVLVGQSCLVFNRNMVPEPPVWAFNGPLLCLEDSFKFEYARSA